MMQQAYFHHVDVLALQVYRDIQERNVEMIQMIQNFLTGAQEEPPAAENYTNVGNIMKAIAQDNIQFKMLRILQETQRNMNITLPPEVLNDSNNFGGDTGTCPCME